jgi:hypothetical protein
MPLASCHLERSASKLCLLYRALSAESKDPENDSGVNAVLGSSLRRRFGLTVSRREGFQGQYSGRNSLNRHLQLKHPRDVSTPRLGFSRGSRERGAPLNMTGAGRIAIRMNEICVYLRKSAANCFLVFSVSPWWVLHNEVLRLRMMHHDRRRRLLRLHVISAGQAHPYGLLGFEQREQLGLVFQVGAGGIAE